MRSAVELERRERPDQRLLEVAHVLLHVAAVPLQVEDRIADELARPVEGRLAAAVRLDDLDVGVVGNVQLRAFVGAPAERDDRRMLEQEHACRAPRPARPHPRASAEAPMPLGTGPCRAA